MSAFPELAASASASAAPAPPAVGARLETFNREQLIVDFLNRGVSVTEIAARIGVGEKRMRAIVRDPRTGIRGLARRMPAAPEEFAAIQVSRLNEALLVAFSAMSATNLKAVDRVVRIVRELDRYHGRFAGLRRRSYAGQAPDESVEPPDLIPGVARFGAAMVCRAEPSVAASLVERPENPAQEPEKLEFAPGIGVHVDAGVEGRREVLRVDRREAALGRPGRPSARPGAGQGPGAHGGPSSRGAA